MKTVQKTKKPKSDEFVRTDDLPLREQEKRFTRDADAFAGLAKEIEEGLRLGKYDSFSVSFSERRRKATEAIPQVTGAKGPRVPIDIKITYSGRKMSVRGHAK